MLNSSVHCKIYHTSDLLEIVSILEQIPYNIQSSIGILIGSRAARCYLRNFRDISDDIDADWDIIVSPNFLLKWLNDNHKSITKIDAIIPTTNDNQLLDLYVYCILSKQSSKYDFVIPRSSATYTAYLLDNSDRWVIPGDIIRQFWRNKLDCVSCASSKLLLILKKYMLYYSHQWVKTAKDYRQLLSVTNPLTDDDTVLCNLFVCYNEKIHGQRSSDTDEWIIHPTNMQKSLTIKRDDFFQYEREKQISMIHQIAMSLSIADDILIGLEYICTKGPLWLADYVINHWMDIHQEKFKQKYELPHPCIEFQIENYRLFPDLPEIAIQRIVQFIDDITDFDSMQFVCKQWYAVLHEEIFWRDLYISRYGSYSGNMEDINSWKILYFIKLQGNIKEKNDTNQKLVDATIQLRNYSANDILQLWEDLTHQNRMVNPRIMCKINSIISNSFYYHLEYKRDYYSARLIIIGLENTRSRSNVQLEIRIGEDGYSLFTFYKEHLSIRITSDNNKPQVKEFSGQDLFGFRIGGRGYLLKESTLLSQEPSSISEQYPSGLLICLFIMMIHPDHRAQHIKYLKGIENYCSTYLED